MSKQTLFTTLQQVHEYLTKTSKRQMTTYEYRNSVMVSTKFRDFLLFVENGKYKALSAAIKVEEITLFDIKEKSSIWGTGGFVNYFPQEYKLLADIFYTTCIYDTKNLEKLLIDFHNFKMTQFANSVSLE